MNTTLKNLSYDGSTEWKTFIHRFRLVSDQMELRHPERAEFLVSTLQGDAFKAIMYAQRSKGGLSFKEICSRLDSRYEGILARQEMFHKSSINLSGEQQNRFRELLEKHSSVFASSDLDLGEFSAVQHTIETGAAVPIKQKMRRTPIHFVGEERKHLEQMLQAGVIQPSSSEWAAPAVLVRKKDGNVRWCIDYRKLNKVTKKDVFPLPLIEDCMDALQGNVWFLN